MYFVELRKVARTGMASLGWHLGRGYVQEKITVKNDIWCIVNNQKTIIAECRSKKQADEIVLMLNKEISR